MSDYTVLITGGSRGIGRGIVLKAIKKGYKVLFTYKSNTEKAEETCAQARAMHSDAQVHAYALDISQPAAVDSMIDRLVDEHVQIHALVNNAAIARDNAAVLMSNEEWDEVIHTNLGGAFYLARTLLMHFIPNHFGRIVNLTSPAAEGTTGQVNYAASKAGLMGLTYALAREYGPKNITTNAVMPGLVDTDMLSKHISMGAREMWNKYSPLRRMPTVEEVADAVLFLISNEASSINGEVLRVTGGCHLSPH